MSNGLHYVVKTAMMLSLKDKNFRHHHNLMGPPSYILSVEQNINMRPMTVVQNGIVLMMVITVSTILLFPFSISKCFEFYTISIACMILKSLSLHSIASFDD